MRCTFIQKYKPCNLRFKSNMEMLSLKVTFVADGRTAVKKCPPPQSFDAGGIKTVAGDWLGFRESIAFDNYQSRVLTPLEKRKL